MDNVTLARRDIPATYPAPGSGPRILRALCRQNIPCDVDLTIECGKIKISVLLIAGDKDRICLLGGMRELQRLLLQS
ncbi:MAG: alpha/beta fold hydrolase [Candidatus Omnitrophota bacterium]